MTFLRDNVFSQYLSTTSRLTIMVDSMVIPFHDYLSKHSSEYEFKQTTKFYCQKNSHNSIYQVNLSFLKLSRFTSSSPTDTLQKLYLGMKAKAPGGQRACGKVHYSLPPLTLSSHIWITNLTAVSAELCFRIMFQDVISLTKK